MISYLSFTPFSDSIDFNEFHNFSTKLLQRYKKCLWVSYTSHKTFYTFKEHSEASLILSRTSDSLFAGPKLWYIWCRIFDRFIKYQSISKVSYKSFRGFVGCLDIHYISYWTLGSLENIWKFSIVHAKALIVS